LVHTLSFCSGSAAPRAPRRSGCFLDIAAPPRGRSLIDGDGDGDGGGDDDGWFFVGPRDSRRNKRCDNSNLSISPTQRLCMSGCNLPTSCSFLRVNRTASLQLGISQVAFSTSIAPPTQKTSEQPNFAYARGFLSRLPAHCSQNDSSPSRLSPRSLAGGACSSPAPCVPIHLSFGCLRLGHL
jgi:hypothetical protein